MVDLNAANRLTSVDDGSITSSYTYNGLGDRLSQMVDSVTTDYVLDLNAGLTQVLDDGNNIYLYGNGRIGELQPGGFSYHLGDALGSVRQLSDASGEVTLAKSYAPFGSVLTSDGEGSSTFAFAGEQWDSQTELTYLRARFYAPHNGIFLSHDALSFGQTSAYNYAGANPILFSDPSGMCKYKAGDPLLTCRVEPGDWIYKIARDYNIEPQNLLKWNGNRDIIRSGELIYLRDPDQVIVMPTAPIGSIGDAGTVPSTLQQWPYQFDGVALGWNWDVTVPGILGFRPDLQEKFKLLCDQFYATFGQGTEIVYDLVHKKSVTFHYDFITTSVVDIGSVDTGPYRSLVSGFSKNNQDLRDYSGVTICATLAQFGASVGVGGSLSASLCGTAIPESTAPIGFVPSSDLPNKGIWSYSTALQISAGASLEVGALMLANYRMVGVPQPMSDFEVGWITQMIKDADSQSKSYQPDFQFAP